MKKSSIQVLLILGIAVTSGCSRYILQSAVAAIAAQIRPSDSPVVAKLMPMGNPKGEGIVVFARINNHEGSYAHMAASLLFSNRVSAGGMQTRRQSGQTVPA
jgi:hypothetical protein